jgi:hypothetical protein
MFGAKKRLEKVVLKKYRVSNGNESIIPDFATDNLDSSFSDKDLRIAIDNFPPRESVIYGFAITFMLLFGFVTAVLVFLPK